MPVSTFRLNLLRAMYLLMLVGLGITIWPLFAQSPLGVESMTSVVRAVLVGLSLMAALGLRYPLKMLPLLLFELTWKVVWVAAFGIPLWLAHRLDANALENLRACLLGVVLVPLVLPWGYVCREFVRAPTEPWGARRVREPVPATNP